MEKLDARNNEFFFTQVVPELLIHFGGAQPQGRYYEDLVPSEYPSLLENEKYYAILKTSRKFRDQYFRWQLKGFEGMKDVSNMLERELADW